MTEPLFKLCWNAAGCFPGALEAVFAAKAQPAILTAERSSHDDASSAQDFLHISLPHLGQEDQPSPGPGHGGHPPQVSTILVNRVNRLQIPHKGCHTSLTSKQPGRFQIWRQNQKVHEESIYVQWLRQT